MTRSSVTGRASKACPTTVGFWPTLINKGQLSDGHLTHKTIQSYARSHGYYSSDYKAPTPFIQLLVHFQGTQETAAVAKTNRRSILPVGATAEAGHQDVSRRLDSLGAIAILRVWWPAYSSIV